MLRSMPRRRISSMRACHWRAASGSAADVPFPPASGRRAAGARDAALSA